MLSLLKRPAKGWRLCKRGVELFNCSSVRIDVHGQSRANKESNKTTGSGSGVGRGSKCTGSERGCKEKERQTKKRGDDDANTAETQRSP